VFELVWLAFEDGAALVVLGLVFVLVTLKWTIDAGRGVALAFRETRPPRPDDSDAG